MGNDTAAAAKPVKAPGPEHPITVERNPNRIVIKARGQVVADTRNALTLREADYPPAHYIPRQDAAMPLLARTEHSTHCPYKGDAAYYSVSLGGDRLKNAAWSYEHPHEAVAVIAGHLAFYPDRVDITEEAGGA